MKPRTKSIHIYFSNFNWQGKQSPSELNEILPMISQKWNWMKYSMRQLCWGMDGGINKLKDLPLHQSPLPFPSWWPSRKIVMMETNQFLTKTVNRTKPGDYIMVRDVVMRAIVATLLLQQRFLCKIQWASGGRTHHSAEFASRFIIMCHVETVFWVKMNTSSFCLAITPKMATKLVGTT